MTDTPSSPSPARTRTRKKKRAPKPSTTRLSKYGDFENEIVTHIVKPRIDHLLKEGVSSVNDLTQKFREAFDSGVTLDTMKEWLNSLGYILARPKVTLSISPSSQGLHSNPLSQANPLSAQSPSSPAPEEEFPDPSPEEEPIISAAPPPGASLAMLRSMEAQGQVIDQPFRSIPT